jgi:hypothetical protein
MLTKTHKSRLFKVCKVLFPKYKYARLDALHHNVTLSNCKIPFIRMFFPSWTVSLTEMISFQIPNQLADFKWGNKTFISVIQGDLVRCELTGTNKIDYFLEEITAIKYADVYKELKISPETVKLVPVPDDEDIVFEEMIRVCQNRQKSPIRKSNWMSMETAFYISLLIITIYSLIMRL